MKPKTEVVMADIIQQIREKFPFDLSEEELCAETCRYGCPKKLLEYMETNVIDWEKRLENHEIPNFQDIQKLSKTGCKIYRILEMNNLVERETDPESNCP